MCSDHRCVPEGENSSGPIRKSYLRWGLLIAGGLMAAVVIVYVVWSLTGEAKIRTDYLAVLNEMAREEITEGENAWPYYEKAIALYHAPPEAVSEFLRGGQGLNVRLPAFAEASAEYQQALRDYVDENRSSLDALDEELGEIAEDAFAKGLVPYLLDSEEGPLSWNRFDEALEKVRIEAVPDADDGVYSSYDEYMALRNEYVALSNEYPDLYSDYRYEMEVWGKILAVDTEPDLGERLVGWGTEHASTEERAIVQEAVNLAALMYWMEHPHKLDDPVIPNLYPFEVEILQVWVQENEEAWAALEEGSRQSYRYFRYSCHPLTRGWLIAVTVPSFSEIRGMMFQGRWRSRFALRKGQTSTALDECITMLRVGNHFMGRRTIIEQLVGSAFASLGMEQLLEILDVGNVKIGDLDPTLQSLKALQGDRYPLLDIESERLIVKDVIQRVFTDGGPGGGHLIGAEMKEVKKAWVVGSTSGTGMADVVQTSIVHAKRNATEKAMWKIFENEVERTKLTPYERTISNLPITEELLAEIPYWRYELVYVVRPCLERASEIMFEGRAYYEATVTVLALERWRLEKGEYPTTLEALVDAKLLDAVPLDPYSDGPLVYRRTAEGFILYSVWTDMVDDGGTTLYEPDGTPKIKSRDEGADWVFWPLPKREPPLK